MSHMQNSPEHIPPYPVGENNINGIMDPSYDYNNALMEENMQPMDMPAYLQDGCEVDNAALLHENNFYSALSPGAVNYSTPIGSGELANGLGNEMTPAVRFHFGTFDNSALVQQQHPGLRNERVNVEDPAVLAEKKQILDHNPDPVQVQSQVNVKEYHPSHYLGSPCPITPTNSPASTHLAPTISPRPVTNGNMEWVNPSSLIRPQGSLTYPTGFDSSLSPSLQFVDNQGSPTQPMGYSYIHDKMNEPPSNNMENDCKFMSSYVGDNFIRNIISGNQENVEDYQNIFPEPYTPGTESLDGSPVSTPSLETSFGVLSVDPSPSVKKTPETTAVGKVLLNDDSNRFSVFQTSQSSLDIANLEDKGTLKEGFQTPQLSPSSMVLKEDNQIPAGVLFQTPQPGTHNTTLKEGHHITPVMKMTDAELPKTTQAEHSCGTDYSEDMPILTLVAGAASSSKTKQLKKSSKKSVVIKKNFKKISKREAAKKASLLSQLHENHLAELAKNKQITDEELLRLKPKKKRRAAKFESPIPSRFCHVCSRTPKNVRIAVCSNITSGTCRKVLCEKCVKHYDLGDFENAIITRVGGWKCSHCKNNCPVRAQCKTYGRINDKLRVDRLKTYKATSGKRGNKNAEDKKDVKKMTDAEKTSMAEGENRKLRLILPAIASSSKTMEIGNPIDDMHTTAVENMEAEISSLNLHEWSNPKEAVAVYSPQVNQNELQAAVERSYPEVNDVGMHTAAEDIHPKVNNGEMHTVIKGGFPETNQNKLHNAVEGNYPEANSIGIQTIVEGIYPEVSIIAMEPVSENISDSNNAVVDNDVPYNAGTSNTSMGTDIMDSAGVNNSVTDNAVKCNAGMNNTYMDTDVMETDVMDNDVMGSAGMNNAVLDNAAMGNSIADNAVDLNDGAELGVMIDMPSTKVNNGSIGGNLMFGMKTMLDDCIQNNVSRMDAAGYEVLGAGVLGADTTEQFEIDEYERDVTNHLNNIIAKVRDEDDEIGRW